ncbi:MIP/aquaporin family protein [Mollicutes bacterium LVI A0078]|nr:MIP/aquaporin family protein [Mollicutes bacterium LVI A0075]WOO91369.1 MIP/aquaporin family protein [Mollicutes bacterium LVI A0078]
MNEFTALQMIFAEFVGTFVLILIGTGTCAAVTLDKSPAKDSGWLFITFGWGFAVLSGALITIPISGGHLNPAVSFAFLLMGDLSIGLFIGFVIAQILGAILGAFMVYQLYYDYFQQNEDGDLVGIFATGPTIENIPRNYLSEIMGTFLLVLFILGTTLYTDLAPVFVPLVVVAIGISLGNITGYAINPARDLGPRIMYHLFVKHPNKGSSNFGYQHVPVFGPLIGSMLAVVVFIIMI